MNDEQGFDFSLHGRNRELSDRGVSCQGFRTTGTTIAGCVFDGGVVLGSDTRATGGSVVVDKNNEKIHYISENIRCCGAGTAADTSRVSLLVSSRLRLFRMNTGLAPRVDQAATMFVNHLFRYGGHVSAHLVLGGFDFQGASVYTISSDGCLARSPFAVMGSGMCAAVSVLEERWRPGLDEGSAKELIADAIEAGITNDLGSGSNVNLCVITARGSEMLERYRVTNERLFRIAAPLRGFGIEVLRETTRPLQQPEVHLEILDGGATSD